jgi:hypothetical protein
VVERTTKFEANGSSHAADRTPPDATMLDLTPCSLRLRYRETVLSQPN